MAQSDRVILDLRGFDSPCFQGESKVILIALIGSFNQSNVNKDEIYSEVRFTA